VENGQPHRKDRWPFCLDSPEIYRHRYRTHIEPALGTLGLGRVEGRHVAELVREMREDGYAEATIGGTLVVLRGIYRLARTRKCVSRSPVDELDPAERPRPRPSGRGRILDEGQLELLAWHARGRLRPLVTLLAFSGLRLSEASACAGVMLTSWKVSCTWAGNYRWLALTGPPAVSPA
jgi:site-specific recombinase XerD